MPEVTDVEVDAPSGTPLAAVRDRVLAIAGADAGECLVVDGVAAADGAVVGRWPLLHGIEVVVAPCPPATGPGGSAAPAAGGRQCGPVVSLVAVAGPDSGRVFPLRHGGTVVGRHPGADAVLADPDVSRRHCRVVLTAAGAEVTDLGSTNGTTVVLPHDPGRRPSDPRAAPVDGRGTAAPLGARVLLGSTRLEVRAVPPPPAGPVGGERGDGTVVHTPSRRVSPVPAERVFHLPAPPTAPERRRLPWLAALLPLAVAVPLALWWGSPAFLLLGLLGPVMIVGSVVSERRDGRRRARAAAAAHAEAVREVRTQAAIAAGEAADAVRHAHPDGERVLRSAVHRDARLWERDPQGPAAAVVRVGTATGHVGVRIDPPTDPATGGARRPGTPVAMDGLPLLVDVDGGVAISGPDEWVDGVARGIVGRLCTALSPEDLAVTVCAADPARRRSWAWTRWLPHATPMADVTELTADVAADVDREADATSQGAGRRRLVVVDHPSAASAGALADLASRSAVALLVLGDGVTAPGCTWQVQPCGESGAGIRVTAPDTPLDTAAATFDRTLDGVADPAGPWWAERLARALAPVRASTGDRGRLPGSVTLADLVTGRAGVATAADVAARWDDPGRAGGLAVPLACDAAGPVDVDLVRDGPHALVAGTTGSGKSELLRSLVLGLAWCHPPEDVAFLLVDFKGGATFAEAAGLPHTLETLTDLDVHAAGRVLASLRAELRRREHLFAGAAVPDLATYRRAGHAADDPVPRLVVVVDEFRVLADEAPDVLDGLVRVAAVGRSLGVHLVLATQRPAGVVSADIRANTALRIALRVEDAGESRDVVDVADAAHLPRSAPGRAVLSRAGTRTLVQTARVAGDGTTDGTTVQVRPVDPVPGRPADDTGPARKDSSAAGHGSATDDGRTARSGALTVVAACREAVSATGRHPARAPWPAPLPATVGWDDARDDDREPVPGPSLPLALLDVPDEQRRAGLHWRPAGDGILTISGGPRSGRTTTCTTVAASALAAGVPAVAVCGDPATRWPRGTVTVDRHDGDHLVDVLAALAARAGTNPADWVCLVVDDADGLLEAAIDRPRLMDLLTMLARDATAARVAVAAAGGRGVLAARPLTGGRIRVLLRPADPADTALVGVRPRDLPRAMPPGRCVVSGLGPGGPVEGQVLLASVGTTGTADPGGAAGDVVPRALPARVPWSASAAHWPMLPLGVGPRGTVDVDVRDCPVVAGPPGSGRTTVLLTMGAAAAAAGASVLVVRADPTLPPGWDGSGSPVRAVTLDQIDGVLDAARADRPVMVLVDDVDRHGQAADDLVASVIARIPTGGRVAVAVSATTGWLAGSFRGVAADARRRGCGVMLHPGRHDGRDVLGIAVAAQESRVPGRGVLVRSGTVTRVQITEPPAVIGPSGAPPGRAPTARPPPPPRRPPRPRRTTTVPPPRPRPPDSIR